MKARSEALAAAIGLALAFSALVLSSCLAKKEPIRIGVNPWPPCELWYVAQRQGYLDGVEVKIVRFSTWTDDMKALPLGDVDIAHSSYFNALYYRNKGKEGRIVLKSDTVEGGDGLVMAKGMKSVAELKGRKIAVETGTDEHFLLYKALERAGLGESDVTILSAASDKAAELFRSGAVDACFTYEPYLSQAAEGGKGAIAFTTKDIPNTMIDCLVASSELVSRRPKDLRRLLGAYLKAQEWVKAHPAEAFALMGGNEKMAAADFEAFYGSFRFFSAAETESEFSSAHFAATLAEMDAFLEAHNLAPRRTALGDIVWNPGL